MEIGSEFWLNDNETVAYNYEVPSWLQKYENVVLTSSGRGTISLILDFIKPKKKSVLLPCYICDSVIKPFENAGYEIFFFDLSKDLKPITLGLEKLEIGVFLHMSYFGFPTNIELTDFISELKSQSVIIIEDITHSLFSEKPTFQNDFIIGSIRKWFGIPSGAFLASKKKIDIKLQDHPNAFIEKRNSGLVLKFEYIQTHESSLKDMFIKNFMKRKRYWMRTFIIIKWIRDQTRK